MPDTLNAPTTTNADFDVAIVGAGPGGCSCAVWLHQLGLRCLLLDQQAQVCSGLLGLDFAQDWVLGFAHTPLAVIAETFAAHLQALPGVQLHLGEALKRIERTPEGPYQLTLNAGRRLSARALVLATGLQSVRPAHYFDLAQAGLRVLDAIGLTQARDHLAAQDVLLLGGGDNAVENALHLDQRGHRVTLWARSELRANPALVQALGQHPRIRVRRQTPMPSLCGGPDGSVRLERAGAFTGECYGVVAVLFGFEPALQVLRVFEPPATAPLNLAGLFLAGDLSQRLHPCVSCAIADGVTAAKQVQQWLSSSRSV